MKTLPPRLASASILLSLALASCGLAPTPASTDDTLTAQALRAPSSGATLLDSWRNEIIYFAVTDRFSNGDLSNDNGANRDVGDRADRSNPLAWQGGDLAGLTRKIEEGYFRKMGFTAIWITPVTLQVPAIPVGDGPNQGKISAGYHGYWADDFFKIDPHFGTMQDLKRFVQTAKRNNLKVIQDVVVNHAGYGSTLAVQHPEWFHTSAECNASTNKDQDCALAGLPDFKQDLPQVRDYLNRFVSYWIRETGIDALRMDTMKHVDDSYWPQFFAPGGPGDAQRIWTVGEIYNGDPAFLARYMNEFGAPSVFDFPLYFNIKDHLSSANGNLDAIAGVFSRDVVYNDARRLTTFVDNHDVKRFVNEVTDRGGSTAEARERLDLALSLIYTSRGIPSVYYGTEIAMPGGGDPYNFPVGQTNREPMDFSAVDASPLARRLAALATARQKYRVLRDGAQQELWRPNGGAPILAYRRVASTPNDSLADPPVVFVVNNSNAPIDLASLPGGGIPLLGTFLGGPLTEITGRASNLRAQNGKLVGTVPARTLLAVTGLPGLGSVGLVNPGQPNPTGLVARAGDGAVRLSWTPTSASNVSGYRVYQRRVGTSTFTQLNFAPLDRAASDFLVRGLTNGAAYEFKVVTVSNLGTESSGATTTATPSATATTRVTFTVDALSQGNGQVQLRRFDAGGEQRISMEPVAGQPGIWTKTLDLPLFREIKFKFGNDAATAKNSGYEGPGQPDRSFTVGVDANTYSGVYDFISEPVPNATVTGRVTSGGANVAGALVEAGGNPNLFYARTFSDGTYFLRVPSGAQTLNVAAPGFISPAARNVTAPATNVDFDLARDIRTKYTMDGNLADWTSPRASASSPAEGVFGPLNNFLELKTDFDADFLYVAYQYTIQGNGAIVYLDVKPGGFTTAQGLSAWPRNITFTAPNAGIDAFLARWDQGDLQLWRSDSGTQVSQLATPDTRGVSSANGVQTVELAIPWSVLGGKPASGSVNVYGAIVGGDHYGSGDIIPNLPGNTISDDASTRATTFGTPLNMPLN